jgi:hypothetical protein
MQHSTAVALAFLMLGQFVILAIGAFVLWLAGDFGHTPKLFGAGLGKDRAQDIQMRQDSGTRLVSLAQDHSIQPQAGEDRIERLEPGAEHVRDRAVG